MSAHAATVTKTLQPGTRRLVERHGEALVCVRYRVDEARGRRLTTIELIVEDKPLKQRDVLIRIAYGEAVLRQQVKAAGGQWDATLKLWRVPLPAVRRLKLESRITEVA